MELTAKCIDTVGGKRLRLQGPITRAFGEKFLFHPSPYSYCPIDSETGGLKGERGLRGYAEYLLGSQEEFNSLLESFRRKVEPEGHKINLTSRP
jgi:hypothetical protein